MGKHCDDNLAEILLEAEKLVLNNYLEKIFGYHILQLGGFHNINFLKHSPITHKIYFNSANHDKFSNSNVQGDFTDLPFLENSIDLVVIPHLLIPTDKIEAVLSEVFRILIGEGHVIILGINPLSLLGIADKLKLTDIVENKKKTNLVRIGRMANWLHRFGFQVVEKKTFFFRPPIKNTVLLKKMAFIEIAGQMLFPTFGGIYILIAKKKTISLNPIKHYIHKKRRFVVVSSSAR